MGYIEDLKAYTKGLSKVYEYTITDMHGDVDYVDFDDAVDALEALDDEGSDRLELEDIIVNMSGRMRAGHDEDFLWIEKVDPMTKDRFGRLVTVESLYDERERARDFYDDCKQDEKRGL